MRTITLWKNNHSASYTLEIISHVSGLGVSYEAEDQIYANGFVREFDRKQKTVNIIIDLVYPDSCFQRNLELTEWLVDAKDLELYYHIDYEGTYPGEGYLAKVSLIYYTHNDGMTNGSGTATLSFKQLEPWYYTARWSGTGHIDCGSSTDKYDLGASIVLTVYDTALTAPIVITQSTLGDDPQIISQCTLSGDSLSITADDTLEYSNDPKDIFIRKKDSELNTTDLLGYLDTNNNPFGLGSGAFRVTVTDANGVQPKMSILETDYRGYI